MKRLSTPIGFLALIAVTIAAGCSKEQEGVPNAKAAQTSAGEKKPVSPAVEKPRFETIIIPDGTNVVASLDSRLSTETNHTGDAFHATTTQPIMVGGRTAVPTGTSIHGVLRDVQASGRTSGRARMTLAYETIVDSEGKTHGISAQPLTLQAASATHDDVEKIAAGAVLGAIIGGIAGDGKGAAIGAGAGAGAGTVLMLATKGDEVELEAGQKMNVQMTSSTSLPVLAQK